MHCSSNQLQSNVRTSLQITVALACAGALMACGGDRTSDRPSASAATEPEQKTSPATNEQRVIEETAKTSERLADQTGAQAAKQDKVPGQPNNQPSDLERAASIRQALTAAPGLSAGARNVNVAVEQGRVTLRGRVESAVEKARVEDMARTAAGSARIVNELEAAP